GDAELGPGKFLGAPCPKGHRVRYLAGRNCVLCTRLCMRRSFAAKKARAAAAVQTPAQEEAA
ncbi:MAG: hypothetical protein ACREUG_08335, partial [Steroidobacteraceae bacterium]